MIRPLKAFRKINERDPVRFSSLLLTVMVVLLGAQLIWWVIFFEINFRKSLDVRNEFDRLALAIAEDRPITPDEFPFLEQTQEGFQVRSDVIENRRKEHLRQLVMLISETAFVLVVITYGSHLILRSIQKERRLARERSAFINSVTHELKTPLATLLLHQQTMLMRKLSKTQQKDLLEQNILAIRRLEDQINNILLSSEMDRMDTTNTQGSSIPSFHKSPLRLYPAIDSFLQEHAIHYSRSNGARFRFVEASGGEKRHPCIVHFNRELFHKVLLNLVSNSVRYCDTTPEISISIQSRRKGWKKFCIVTIQDNGKGIEKGELENIFKPFYRLQSDKESIRGSGIGLHLVREIIQSAGGTIHADSAGPGQGTTFQIHLPAISAKME